MPETNVVFQPREQLLSFEEIVRVTQVACQLGIRKVRITGGEPLVRQELPELIRMLSQLEALEEIALTTNGVLLADQAMLLKDAGLQRINISLDTLNEATFQRLARRDELPRVLAGIDAALTAGFRQIRLNALAIAGLTESEVIPLVRYAAERNLEMRFIEYMPLDADQQWSTAQVLSGQRILEILESEWGKLEPASRDDPSQPATNYWVPGTSVRIGLINSVTESFCGQCNRLRLTADGRIRNCLFSVQEWDLRELLRSDGTDESIAREMVKAIQQKRAGHGSDDEHFVRPERAMYQIGG